MVKRVSLFQAADGRTFASEQDAKNHEANIAAKATVAALLAKLGVDGSILNVGEETGVLLETFLIDNRADLVLALTGNAVKVKKERKPRKPKSAVPETPAVVEKGPVDEPATAPQPTGDEMLETLVSELGN